ncbi:alanine racemase [Fusobacterium sp.]|uniref:alanine racemase n=1 Tax=Fusobacterium sp. TaxID=68766 RepID=UPI00396CDDF3
MKKEELRTPKILLEFETLRKNINGYQQLCDINSKEMWPMIKTHKSTEILKYQIQAGAKGVLCGTLDEAEACCDMGIKNIMYAYPVASAENILRVVELSKKSDFIIRLDNYAGAEMINEIAQKNSAVINYTVIIDSGLHRFGVAPDRAVEFVKRLSELKNLKFKGISTHPGHVYGAGSYEEIARYTEDECTSLHIAKENLQKAGFNVEIVSSGSTPTFEQAVKDKNINIYHPGNYVFYDVVQASLKVAKADQCALKVYTTIISQPAEDIFICDAGAKCLGLDKGAHGNSLISGYGAVAGHPELVVDSLSEEVGKIKINGKTELKVGDKIEVIPNHSCSTANMTSYYTLVDKDRVIGTIDVDIRGNSKK